MDTASNSSNSALRKIKYVYEIIFLIFKMKQTIFAAVLALALGITSGFPVFKCDKLIGVDEGANSHDQYLVKLKDSNNYMDANNLIGTVKQYQTTLEMYASNVHGSSVKSELELSENTGVLRGTLSQQALILVCLESSVESITPDYYSKLVELPEGSGEVDSTVTAIDCPKFVPDGSHRSGNDYSITFQPKTSTVDLYYIIMKIEIAEQQDNSLNFKYYHSVRKGKQLFMLAEMNTKALEMVCKEVKVKEIKVSHDIYTVSKRDVTTEQEVTTSGPCDLPEHQDEFPRFIFQYNEGADLDAIRNMVEGYTANSAEVRSARVLGFLDTIIFQMNRAAYLQACTNPEITLVEYEIFTEPVPAPVSAGHCSLPERQEDFPKYIFVYNRGADVEAIKKTVEEYTENSAEVKSAVALTFLDMIIFQMNRAAYLQACTNSEIMSVEYDEETEIAQEAEQPQQEEETTVGAQQQQQTTDTTDICEQVDSLPDSYDTYRAVFRRPGTVEGQQNRCSRLVSRLQSQAESEDGFWVFATSQSCATSGTEVSMTVRLNVEALRYTCGLKGLDISVVRRPVEVEIA